MSKPIEPGCLALVVGTSGCNCNDCLYNRGKLVTVQCLLRPGDPIVLPVLGRDRVSEECWLVRTLGSPLIVALPGGLAVRCSERPFMEHHLLRIDDPDGQDETLTWTPVPTTGVHHETQLS